VQAAGVAFAADTYASPVLQLLLRLARHQFSPTGELGYSGIRGAEGRTQVHYISYPLLLILTLLLNYNGFCNIESNSC
jgi:hypothetical protein